MNASTGSVDVDNIDNIIKNYNAEKSDLIAILQDIQVQQGYLSQQALRHVSKRLNLPLIKVYSVATFYKAFSLKPRGRNLIRVCLGTACHMRGNPKVLEDLERRLHITVGETTSDRNFTLEKVHCVGACALAPVVIINNDYYEKVSPTKMSRILKNYEAIQGKKND